MGIRAFSTPDATPSPSSERFLRALGGPLEGGRTLSLVWIVLLLWASLVITWGAGGTDHMPPHWYYLPIVLAGARFGTVGVVLTALISMVMAGPLTPADVSDGTYAPLTDWVSRGFFFVVIGTFFSFVLSQSRSAAAHELADLRLTTELTGAIDRRDFVLDYQPVVTLDEREVVGAEALIRWEHPDRGRIMPDEFIAQCEASGQIHPIGAWVIDEACRQLATWLKATIDPARTFRLSVNVSGHQLESGDLVGTVERALRRWRVPADRLVLEVTESTVLTEHVSARRQLQHLRDLGVKVAVDDFGTGYSSLAYLRQLPVDIVKIDRTFVERLGGEAHDDDRRIAAGIIDLAHDLGMAVVAEGIESEKQACTLAEIGCRTGQGFLFAPGLTPADLTKLLVDEVRPARATDPVLLSTPRPTPRTAALVRRALRTPDTTGQHQARTTALAALFVAGACMAISTSALTPQRGMDSFIAALLGGCGLPTAALVLKFGHRLPRWSIHLLLIAGTAIVSLGALLSDETGLMVATSSLFVWVVLYAAAFYDWPVAVAHFAVVSGALTALVTITETPQPAGVLIMVLGSAAVAAGVVGWLARQLRAVASTDLLTGLPNRQSFEAQLPREIARANRDATSLCLAVVDIDDFKEINDTHGHQAGDEILARLPAIWQLALREGDILARVGGDEFVVLLPDCLLDDAATVLERMGATSDPTCSVGVAALGEGESPDRLMARADRALYAAKRRGTGLVVADRPDPALDPEPQPASH